MEKFIKKLKKFVLKNRLLSILIFLFILIFILGLVFIKVFIFPSYGTTKYGNRLNGINDVKLTDSRFNEVKDNLGEVSGFEVSKFRLSGKIINIYVSVDENISIKDVKENCSKLVSGFSEQELSFYDIQVFVTGSKDIYPLIGYKNKNSEGLYWNLEGESNEK